MAGVSAAKRLSEHGIDKVVVVEGSDRVGGRVKDVQFGGITVEVGANWVHFSNMREHELNPIELLVKDAKLNYIEDDYQDLIFGYRGANVTAEYNQLYSRLYKAVKNAVDVAERKDKGNEPDISFRAALALADWRPTHPLEKAAEYFEFDFEFGDEPENTGIKSNAKVYTEHSKHDLFIADSRGYSRVIRDVAASIPLRPGQNLILNKYVTDVKYKEDGKYPIEVLAKDTETGKYVKFKAKWSIMTFR